MENKTKKKLAKGKGSKKKAAAQVAVDEEPGKSQCASNHHNSSKTLADPWIQLRSPLGGKLSPAEEWKRIQDPASRGRELTVAGCAELAVLTASTPEALRLATATKICNIPQENHPEAEATMGATDVMDTRPVERLIFRGENPPFAENPSVCWCLLMAGLVSFDVGGTGLDDAGVDKIVSWTPWLRELKAAGNNITRLPNLSGWSKLQVLDLSHNYITVLGPGPFPPELAQTLRRLNLAGNSLDRLTITTESGASSGGHQAMGTCALYVLTSLVDLDISKNKLDDPESSVGMITKAGFPRLISLDFTGNQFSLEQETGELIRISKALPTLTTVNGEAVSRTAMAISSKQHVFETLSTSEQCVQEGRREESCSCTEGNPCAVAYHCRDWVNRFEVAAAAAAGASAKR